MWRVFRASATGKRNLEHGVAGQDASHCAVMDDVLVAVVSDGAGSVPEGRTGSDFIARALVEELSGAASPREALEGAGARPETAAQCRTALEAAILRAVEAARARLAGVAGSRQLALHDFSCTLVGCVASRGGGCFFHIGDGYAIYQNAAGSSVLSRPENGEYADETFFVTDEDWKDHLRLTPIPAPERGCIIGLMSDGTAPFAVNRERGGFFRPFIDPIASYLRKATAANGEEALRNLLESPRACEISHDDKTLLLAFVV